MAFFLPSHYRCHFALLTGLGALLASVGVQATTLTIANGAEPGTLDPQQKNGTWEARIDEALFTPLLAYDAKGKLIPGLADHWEVSQDGLHYTFHLRNASWSDGQPITAEDAAFALRREVTPATAAFNANVYYAIQNAEAINRGKLPVQRLGVKATDAHTLAITLEHPDPSLLSALAMVDSAPLPAHYLKAHPKGWVKAGQLVTSGPFTLAEWQPQDFIKLKRNPHFYAADQVKLDEVIVSPIDDPNAALNRFRTGQFDISYTGIPNGQLESLKRTLGTQVKVAPLLGEYYYLFNVRKSSVLRDKRIREALNLAVRRDIITDRIVREGDRPSLSFIPKAMSGGTRGEMPFAHMPMEKRLARARALLKEAGYGPDHPLILDIAYNTLASHRQIAIAVSAMWRRIGVNTTLTNRDAAVHFATLRSGRFQVGRAGIVATIDNPNNLLDVFKTNNASNYAGYSNPDFDREVTAAGREIDPAKRAQLLTQAQQTLLDDYALLPIYDYVSLNLVSNRVKGWHTNPLDVHPLRYLSVSD